MATGLLVLAGCGSHDRRREPGPAPTQTATQAAADTACPGVTPQLIAGLTGKSDVHAGNLEPDPGSRRPCGTVFYDGAGGLIVQVKARAGSRRDLRVAARTASQLSSGSRPERLRPVRGLGPGAFLAGRRVIGFRRGGRVVTVETGYAAGRLALDLRQLRAVAAAVARRV